MTEETDKRCQFMYGQDPWPCRCQNEATHRYKNTLDLCKTHYEQITNFMQTYAGEND
jgi:hypothetical protein